MSDNVIILGAGFSYDAGIPLLSGFVDKMWEFAIRQKYSTGKEFTKADIKLFENVPDPVQFDRSIRFKMTARSGAI